MSSTASPYYTSVGEQTIFAFQDNFILPSDATGRRTSAADVYPNGSRTFASSTRSAFYPSRAENIGANLDFPVSDAECFHEESHETYSYSPYRAGDKDWELYNRSTEALPIIDSDFYEDADACIDSATMPYGARAAVADEDEDEDEDEDIILEDNSYDDTEHLDLTGINEMLDNFEIRSQADYVPTEFEQSLHQETLLQDWQYDYQRHEWVALKFQQPPYTTESYIEPYSVPYTTEHQ